MAKIVAFNCPPHCKKRVCCVRLWLSPSPSVRAYIFKSNHVHILAHTVHAPIDRTTKTKTQGSWDDLKEDSIGGEESIRVAVRVRPFNAREAARGCKCCVEMSGQKTTLLGLSDRNGDGRKYCFFFRVVRCICGQHSNAHDVCVYGMLYLHAMIYLLYSTFCSFLLTAAVVCDCVCVCVSVCVCVCVWLCVCVNKQGGA